MSKKVEKVETLTEMVERLMNEVMTIEVTLRERGRLLGISFEEQCAGVALFHAGKRLEAAHRNLIRHDNNKKGGR